MDEVAVTVVVVVVAVVVRRPLVQLVYYLPLAAGEGENTEADRMGRRNRGSSAVHSSSGLGGILPPYRHHTAD